mgnify:CR=1 FL=1
MGHLARECTSSSKSVAEVQHGDTVEVLFSPDNTVLKVPVVSNRPNFSECSLDVINNTTKKDQHLLFFSSKRHNDSA